MKTPMAAQIIGAVTNIILDPLLIFGMCGLPKMGIAGAAVATVAGQVVAALVVMKKGFRKPAALHEFPRRTGKIFRLGLPNILMQSVDLQPPSGALLPGLRHGVGDRQGAGAGLRSDLASTAFRIVISTSLSSPCVS